MKNKLTKTPRLGEPLSEGRSSPPLSHWGREIGKQPHASLCEEKERLLCVLPSADSQATCQVPLIPSFLARVTYRRLSDAEPCPRVACCRSSRGNGTVSLEGNHGSKGREPDGGAGAGVGVGVKLILPARAGCGSYGEPHRTDHPFPSACPGQCLSEYSLLTLGWASLLLTVQRLEKTSEARNSQEHQTRAPSNYSVLPHAMFPGGKASFTRDETGGSVPCQLNMVRIQRAHQLSTNVGGSGALPTAFFMACHFDLMKQLIEKLWLVGPEYLVGIFSKMKHMGLSLQKRQLSVLVVSYKIQALGGKFKS